MNTKKILTLSAALGLTAASFGVTATTANELCRIQVDPTTSNSIVAVPLETVGGTESSITLADLVLPTNLATGDLILYKDGDSWKGWQLSDGSWSEISVSSDSVTSLTTSSTSGQTSALATGNAFWLIQSATTPATFYLYGEVPDSTASLVTPTRSTTTTYTMIANPNLADTALTDLVSGTPVAGDKIQIPSTETLGLTEYVYQNSAWCTATTSTGSNGEAVTTYATASSVTIPAGTGFWYVAAPSGN